MKTLGLISILLLFYSCRQASDKSTDKQVNSLNDNFEVIRRYPSGQASELIFHSDNNSIENIGLTEQGDTLHYPQLVYIKSTDSLFVYISNKYSSADLLFDNDSTNVVIGTPKYKVSSLKSSTMLNVNSQMYTGDSQMKGAIKCWDSTANFYRYFAFYVQTK